MELQAEVIIRFNNNWKHFSYIPDYKKSWAAVLNMNTPEWEDFAIDFWRWDRDLESLRDAHNAPAWNIPQANCFIVKRG